MCSIDVDFIMESSQPSQLPINVSEESVETIILTLPSQLHSYEQPSNSSLVRSECGQFFLVTYDAANKIVSKHQINLQINADDFLELKCSSGGMNDVLTRQIMELDDPTSQDDPDELATLSNQIEDRSQAGF